MFTVILPRAAGWGPSRGKYPDPNRAVGPGARAMWRQRCLKICAGGSVLNGRVTMRQRSSLVQPPTSRKSEQVVVARSGLGRSPPATMIQCAIVNTVTMPQACSPTTHKAVMAKCREATISKKWSMLTFRQARLYPHSVVRICKWPEG